MKLLAKLFLTLNILLIICTLGAYISPGINPSAIWFFSVLGLAYPILLLFNLFFIVAWFFIDFKYSLLSILILIIGYPHFNEFIAFNGSNPAQENNSVSTFSYNISNARNAYHKNKDVKKAKRAEMVSFLKKYKKVDILCFQEVGHYGSEVLKEVFSDHQKHSLSKGAIIYTKYPIINKGEIDFQTVTNSCLWADVAFPSDTIRVYSVHLQSNLITNDANRVLDQPDLNNDKTWLGIKGIFAKYVKNHIKRSEQAVLLKSHIESSPYPVIVAGDFNDTPLTYTYRTLALGLNDNYTNAGNGIGTTFNGRIPLLRIDYILSDPKFKVLDFEIIKEDYSDHYPIMSRLSTK